MQGSRHERVAILTTAYIIGFVTAYILYGTTIEDTGKIYEPIYSVASVTSSLTETKDKASNETQYIEEKGKLYFKDGTTEVLLSYNPTIPTTSGLPENSSLTQGIHYTKPYVTESDSGRYVLFCENQEPAKSYCVVYVYDSVASLIYPVTIDNQPLTMSLNSAHLLSWTGEEIVLPDTQTLTKESPWKLSSK